jgi:hypothetical protein
MEECDDDYDCDKDDDNDKDKDKDKDCDCGCGGGRGSCQQESITARDIRRGKNDARPKESA